jgi:hypothetical protein
MTEADASSGRLRRLFAHVGTIDNESTYSRTSANIRDFDTGICAGVVQAGTLALIPKF